MGKFITYMSILVFIDMLFIMTGQIAFTSIGSILINAIINIGSLSLSQLFSQTIGQFGDFFGSASGLGSLIAGGAVVTLSAIFSKNDSILFTPMAIAFALLASDLVLISGYLRSFNPILATLLVAPLAILYIFTCLEWARAKD